MRFRKALQNIDGLRTVASEMELLSGIARSMLLDLEFVTDATGLRTEFDAVEAMLDFLGDRGNISKTNSVCSLLRDARDISLTLKRLEEGVTPDEVELFEIKNLALTGTGIAEALEGTSAAGIESIRIPDLEKVTEILDPEKTGNSHFHIYDAYSPALAAKRKELRKLQSCEPYDEEESAVLTSECMAIEDRVKEELGRRLRNHAPALKKALQAIGKADILLAKARLAVSMDLSRPEPAEGHTSYEGLRYLPVELVLRKGGKEFQPVDLTLPTGVTMITGANMGGKTITLKSVALAQAMMQFGFFVPARSARVVPVKDILLSIGDPQSETDGLSSFGAEILRIDGIIRKASEETTYLILIDEPARTTNPEEGSAIADALVGILGESRSITLLTTHYGNIHSSCHRLKVKGVRDIRENEGAISLQTLNRRMDYSLIETGGKDIDREALAIARLLGIDEAFAGKIETILKDQ